jgi:4-diphosphocytidyl-2-C-methyl-D-erythritol kinase
MAGKAGAVRVKAPAKINLTLRVSGRGSDGYHDLRTVFQSIELHDVLRFERRRGLFEIECDDPACPIDDRNLVWRAAQAVWRASRRRGAVRGVRVYITKRIPMQAGLGGGSSDAAATLRALAELWHLRWSPGQLWRVAASLGADVPFFLMGGTALGVGRGNVLFPLVDPAPMYVVLAMPGFGVSTEAAYGWLDEERRAKRRIRSGIRAARIDRCVPESWMLPATELANDLEGPVRARYPLIGRVKASLTQSGAAGAAMSGSGSAVFGLFDSLHAAHAAASRVARTGCRTATARTLSRRRYAVLAAVRRLAAK